jgi:hypothetical protein
MALARKLKRICWSLPASVRSSGSFASTFRCSVIARRSACGRISVTSPSHRSLTLTDSSLGSSLPASIFARSSRSLMRSSSRLAEVMMFFA